MPGEIDWDKISEATRDQILGDVEDQVFTENVLLNRMKMRGIKKKGGEKLTVKCYISANSGAQSYAGRSTLNTDPISPFIKLQYDWKLYSVPINVSGHERLINQGSEQAIFDIIEEETDIAKLSLAEKLNEDMYLDGTGNGSLDIDGLANIVDDGTNYDLIGGQSRTTYAVLEAQYFANAGVDRQLTYKLANRSHSATLNHGKRASMGLTTVDLLDKLKETLQPHQIVSDTSKPSLGFPNILVNQVPLFADEYCTAERLFWIQERDLFLVTHTNRDFIFVPFREPTNQDAAVAYIWWAGDLVCRKPKTSAVVLDLDEETI